MADLQNRAKRESEFARKTSSLMGRHRRELSDLLGTPPDARNVPASFWEKVKKESEEEFSAILLLIFLDSYAQHSPSDSGTIFRSFGDRLGSQWSEGRAKALASGYADNSREMLDRVSAGWKVDPENLPAKSKVSQDLFSVFGPDRAEGIAITEGTNAITAGSESAVGQSGGLSEDDFWITEDDAKVCPICAPLHETPRPVWRLKFPSGPPAHPRCRCYIRYAKKEK